MNNCPLCNSSASQRIKIYFGALLYFYQKMIDVFESSMTWEKKYDVIFGMRHAFDDLLAEYNTSMNSWYSDSTYEENVRAYMDAVKSTMRDLALID